MLFVLLGVSLATNVGDVRCSVCWYSVYADKFGATTGHLTGEPSSSRLPRTFLNFKYSAITGRTIFDLTFCFALLRCGHDVWYLRFSVAELQFFANRCCSVNVVLILNLSVYCPNTVLKFKNNSRHIGHSYCGNCLCDTVRLSGNSWVTWPRSVLT